MTLYRVEYVAGGETKVATFESMIARALFIISMAPYIDNVRTYEVAA